MISMWITPFWWMCDVNTRVVLISLSIKVRASIIGPSICKNPIQSFWWSVGLGVLSLRHFFTLLAFRFSWCRSMWHFLLLIGAFFTEFMYWQCLWPEGQYMRRIDFCRSYYVKVKISGLDLAIVLMLYMLLLVDTYKIIITVKKL